MLVTTEGLWVALTLATLAVLAHVVALAVRAVGGLRRWLGDRARRAPVEQGLPWHRARRVPSGPGGRHAKKG
jgi:hypothetical protein